MLESCKKSQETVSLELIKGQLALATLMIELGVNASKVLQQVISTINKLNVTENQNIFRLLIESMQDMLDINDSLCLGQHLLIGNI